MHKQGFVKSSSQKVAAHGKSLEDDILDARDVERIAHNKQVQRSELKRQKERAEIVANRGRGRHNAAHKRARGMASLDVHDESENEGDDGTDDIVPERILREARAQREELMMESKMKDNLNDNDVEELQGESSEEEDEDAQAEEEDEEEFEYLDVEQVTEGDEQALALFNQMIWSGKSSASTQAVGRRTLAELIVEKIEAHENERREVAESNEKRGLANAQDPKVYEVFSGVADVMKRYRSGRIPKAFKMIPVLRDWEQVMWLTRPDEWSPHAVLYATRLFASNLKPHDAQVYFRDVLLPRVRDDIEEHKKLNVHLYEALKKALFKPQAFFKGILFPLCDPSAACTLREAVILGSVLSKVSVPRLHAAAALLRVAQMPYSGANSIFVRVLLDKKYSLPYKVIDNLVIHFCKMADPSFSEHVMPVLWHQSLLVFVQRHKKDITSVQKEQLKKLVRVQFHHQITLEIRRELFSSRSRGEFQDPDANTIAARMMDAE